MLLVGTNITRARHSSAVTDISNISQMSLNCRYLLRLSKNPKSAMLVFVSC